VSATGLVAWVAAVEGAYRTRWLPDLSGWAQRSPLLGVALVGLTIATVGVPGQAVAVERSALVAGTIDGPLAWVVRVLLFAPLVALLRVFLVGLRPIGGAVSEGASEWPRRMSGAGGEPLPSGGATGGVVALARDGVASMSRNRAPIASAAVLAVCVVALAAAAGGFGLGQAAAGGPPGSLSIDADPQHGPGAEQPGPSAEQPGPSAEQPGPSVVP
jgi:formate hydrogenlyase subunit 3/multisubunit Na+/H+ antiporter MnhD subunit